MTETIHSYMYDIAVTNGRSLDVEVKAHGIRVALSENKLRELFSNVKVKDMESSYAYVVAGMVRCCIIRKQIRSGNR